MFLSVIAIVILLLRIKQQVRSLKNKHMKICVKTWNTKRHSKLKWTSR